MNLSNLKKKIKELREKIRYHSYKYYTIDSPELSDFEFDNLMIELKKIEEENPDLITSDSPTQIVGHLPLNSFKKVSHDFKMDSLQDVFSYDKIYEFDKHVREVVENPTYVVEPKIDGLSVSIKYRGGQYYFAATRGDGFIGEDVTLNLATIKNLPKKIDSYLGDINVRGEVFISEESFIDLNKDMADKGKPIFKNKRNAAAGSLRQKDPNITKHRNLSVCIFNLQNDIDNIITHHSSLNFLKSMGFLVSSYFMIGDDISKSIKIIEDIYKDRINYPFDIDGVVIKVDSFESRKDLGQTSKFPKWAVAYKYPPEEKTTKLLDIELNVGRTGTITPTAIFDSIDLAGSSVRRAVLHNQDFIDFHMINIGDLLVIRKAGEIIPEIVRNINKNDNKDIYKIPMICPECGYTCIKEDIFVKCVNEFCKGVLKKSLVHFVSRDGMNIAGFGEGIIDKLVSLDLVKDLSDIYYLTDNQFLSIPNIEEKSCFNIRKSIEKSKTQDLYRFIFSLGIIHIGLNASKIICKKFKNIDIFHTLKKEDVVKIDGIGDIIAKSFVDYFSCQKNIDMINRIKLAGVNFIHQKEEEVGLFTGVSFVVTGKLLGYTRKEVFEIIESLGGEYKTTISSKTNYLLTEETTGSKLEKAKKLGVIIINESQFNDIINNKNK